MPADRLLPSAPPHEIYRDLPDLGTERIARERFTSPEVMEQEWRAIWSKTWNCGPRLEELSRPGDYVVEELGRESIIFVRGRDEQVRAFYNVCPHRGNRLCAGKAQGRKPQFYCNFHGWRFDLTGACVEIPDLADFPQFRDGAPQSEVGLTQIKTDTWGGWIWFNLDPASGPLADYLGAIPAHTAPFELERMKLVDFITFEWPCNWKIAADAFNEAYHFSAQHPEMVMYSEDVVEIELLGEHSVMKIPYGSVSSKLPEREQMNPELAEWMMTYYGVDAAEYSGPAKDANLFQQARIREGQPFGAANYARLEDRQITDDFSYFVFPGSSWNVLAEGAGGYRYRPHPTDPNKCFYDLYLLRFVDGDPPKVTRRTLDHTANIQEVMPSMPRQGAVALQQDAASVGLVQQGMHSAGFKGLLLGNQEIRLRHFYRTIDRHLARAGAAQPEAARATSGA